ncbi:hypothetical protein [uncultured Polaribacter sp.]|uniref:hypothetical protein n=1 Tax=uncultured Polaribacter sp. TaxID=174711 RepID=UPI00260A2633|nr:hypothetical protein [uncultured Polaribacter sp.]
MYLKDIIFDKNVTREEKILAFEYFLTRKENQIEGFTFTEKEIDEKYGNTTIKKLLSKRVFHAIFTIENCDLCLKENDIVILNREHLNNYLNSEYILCHKCQYVNKQMQSVLGMGVNTSNLGLPQEFF